ncbi:hypothetical protein [Desulfosudis oleivorans]|uniref:Class I SAM-dependent methyltransferase n=1 Tax=Desulfosudis oleivorans (strain DSM 6200 / JCM 39069 / Hxd3) TaxID=96561 RepID=A8ZU82_DESOH|nr:hypothetical protein [Desulfosudis oleivorans]ABW66394.1 conserved hypothetical protein [Desulfosudis oleivorans Hxd3]
MTPSRPEHWSLHARQWRHIGPPLRPCTQDIRIFEQRIAAWHAETRPADDSVALLLGVTPEIAAMSWPARTRLLAVDHNLDMVRYVWPGEAGCADSMAVCGRWQQMPVRKAAVSMVIGDGCFILMDFPEGYRRVADVLHQVLLPGGCLISRFFTRPAKAPTVSQLMAGLENGTIRSFDAFRIQLAMALQGDDVEKGVCLNDVWQAWQNADIDKEQIARNLGWTPEAMALMDNYRGQPTRYFLPTQKEVGQIFGERFDLVEFFTGDYEMADLCPIMRFVPQR